ncbi:MAG TPA: hypothetical protein V6D04_12400 [Candidatus Obscuribacterales bacterium]
MMVGSVEQIERDIAALEKMLADTADEFYNIYTSYLTALGQAVKQQLILASYHLCTQGYPQQFLRLSFDQRQKLQQALRQVAKQAQATLLEQLRRIDEPPVENAPESAEVLVALPDLEQWLAANSEASETSLPAEAASPEPNELQPDQPKAEESDPQWLTPERLARWRAGVERSLVQTLRRVSREANHLLQQANILPKELPEVLLEAASKAEEVTEAVASPPNLLNLLVETVDQERAEAETPLPPALTHIVAIHLRLGEIEFTDSTVALWRQKLRNLSARLQALGKEYQKKQRERAIAEAEAAWRASWFED